MIEFYICYDIRNKDINLLVSKILLFQFFMHNTNRFTQSARKQSVLYFIILIITFSACEKEEYIKRNQWVIDVLSTYYLWEDYLPATIDPKSNSNTFDFFKDLLYEEDHWSWISDDYYETTNLLNGITTTAGHEYSLYYKSIKDNYNIMGIVEFVMAGSPAEKAGIKRGDTFTRINGTTLNIDNYVELLTSYSSYTIGFDTLKDGILSPAHTVAITEAENFQEDPIYIDTVYEVDGHRIGYFMYNSFLDEYNDAKSDAFARFKSAGVTDLIIDLRYNNGGSAAAESHLANLIAPSDAEGQIFATDHWNRYLTQNFLNERGEDFFHTYIERTDNNIDLKGQLIALTTSSTASASEGLLNGLRPLVDLTLIGDTTHGKYTGMITIPDDEDNPEWAIVPIVVKMTNKDNISVKGGMVPKILLNDNPLDGYQLGDTRETMLARAIEEITGNAISRHSKQQIPLAEKTIARYKSGHEMKPIPTIIDFEGDFFLK